MKPKGRLPLFTGICF